ncbi:MAG: hypothetical protein ABSF18_07400 [Gammaproteobacteria bacterium]|jgi:hypothetical protein
MDFNKFNLVILVFTLTGCVAATTNEDVYWLELPLKPQSALQVDNPLAGYDPEIIDIENSLQPHYVNVTFETDLPHENSASIDIIPKEMSFLKFDRGAEQIVLDDYKDEDHASIEFIYKQEEKLNHHPAIYNIYVVSYDNSDDRIVIMQYLIDYPYYQVDLRYYAHTKAEYHAIFSPRVAIEHTHGAAFEFFESFKLFYKHHEEEDDDDDDEDHEEDHDEDEDEKEDNKKGPKPRL